ncbi:MAG: hypothetical protein ACM3SY_06810 [Candidatus Omnitrophota bacterium]
MNDERKSFFQPADLWILAAGLLTTGLTLFGVYALARADRDFAIMTWYSAFVIPVGAILAGVAAGSGYGLTSWFSGRKISGGLLAILFTLLVATYGAAQWMEFKKLNVIDFSGQSMGFLKYYDLMTRNMTLRVSHAGTSTGILGIWGYFFRLLEIAGFAFGGVIILLGLRTQAYCERCQSYMRKKTEWWIPASVPARNVNRKDAADQDAYTRAQQQTYQHGLDVVQQLMNAVRAGNVVSFRDLLKGNASTPQAVVRLPHRVSISFKLCQTCGKGIVVSTLYSGQGNKAQMKRLDHLEVEGGLIPCTLLGVSDQS